MDWIDNEAKFIENKERNTQMIADKNSRIAEQSHWLWRGLSVAVVAAVEKINSSPKLVEKLHGPLERVEPDDNFITVKKINYPAAYLVAQRFDLTVGLQRTTQAAPDAEKREQFETLYIDLTDEGQAFLRTAGGAVLDTQLAVEHLLGPILRNP